MNPAAKAYYDVRLWGTFAAIALVVVVGGLKVAFGTGRAHVVIAPDETPVLRIDGVPVALTKESQWHRTAELPRGNHRVELELLGEVTTTTWDIGRQTELLVPFKGQCFGWYAYVPEGRRTMKAQFIKRVTEPTLVPARRSLTSSRG